jgi:hypothetical protein
MYSIVIYAASDNYPVMDYVVNSRTMEKHGTRCKAQGILAGTKLQSYKGTK